MTLRSQAPTLAQLHIHRTDRGNAGWLRLRYGSRRRPCREARQDWIIAEISLSPSHHKIAHFSVQSRHLLYQASRCRGGDVDPFAREKPVPFSYEIGRLAPRLKPRMFFAAHIGEPCLFAVRRTDALQCRVPPLFASGVFAEQGGSLRIPFFRQGERLTFGQVDQKSRRASRPQEADPILHSSQPSAILSPSLCLRQRGRPSRLFFTLTVRPAHIRRDHFS